MEALNATGLAEPDSIQPRRGELAYRIIVGGLLAGLVIHIFAIWILASVPPVSRDALTHHLAIPKMYVDAGGMYEIPSIKFSYFPMNLDLLYLVPLYFNSDISAKFIHFIFALFTAGMIFGYLREVLGQIYGIIGALMFLTIPVIVKLSMTVYVDLGLICFTWGTLYFILKWYDHRFEMRYLLYAAVSCGLALGTKYNGLILLPIMAVLVSITFSLRNNQGLTRQAYRQRYLNSLKGVQQAGIFVLVALLIFSPWMIRNFIWKGNPVYPLYNKVFNPPASDHLSAGDKTEKQPPRNAFWTRRHVYKESFAQTLTIPIRAFFQGQDDNPKYFDGKLNPFLLLLPLIAFVPSRRRRWHRLKGHRRLLAVFAALYILFVLFQVDFRIRYMSPAVPALVVLAVFGIEHMVAWISKQDGITKWGAAGGAFLILAFTLFYNADYVYGQFNHVRPFDYLSGTVTRDDYITRYRREYPVIKYANQTLPEDARVLCLSLGNRTYYLNRPVHLAEDFYHRKDGQFRENELLRKLKRHGTTHIIMDKVVAFNWLRSLKPEERQVFLNVFQYHTRLMYEKSDVLLLEFISHQ